MWKRVPEVIGDCVGGLVYTEVCGFNDFLIEESALRKLSSIREKRGCLVKGSRPVQKTPIKFHLMPDFTSDSSSPRGWPEDKHKFFIAPSIFIGFNLKGSSDS